MAKIGNTYIFYRTKIACQLLMLTELNACFCVFLLTVVRVDQSGQNPASQQPPPIREGRSGLLPSGTFETRTLDRHQQPSNHAESGGPNTGSLPRYHKSGATAAMAAAAQLQQQQLQQHQHQQHQHQQLIQQIAAQQHQQLRQQQMAHVQQQMLQRGTYGSGRSTGQPEGDGHQWPRHVPNITSGTHVPVSSPILFKTWSSSMVNVSLLWKPSIYHCWVTWFHVTKILQLFSWNTCLLG